VNPEPRTIATLEFDLRPGGGHWPVSTNRFLAKLAASLHKPDGLDVIDHTNILDVYKRVKLLDLNGINTRFQARLNAYRIFTPMEFYQAPLEKLKKQVFQTMVRTKIRRR
jgi:DNA polymerase IV